MEAKGNLIVVGDMPSCIFCNQPAALMLFKQEDKDDINLFLLCRGHWEEFRKALAAPIPDAFLNAYEE